MMMTQVKLTRKDSAGIVENVCWLEADRRIKPGARLTLKDVDSGLWWDVAAVYETMDKKSIPQKWEAGGLSSRTYDCGW